MQVARRPTLKRRPKCAGALYTKPQLARTARASRAAPDRSAIAVPSPAATSDPARSYGALWNVHAKDAYYLERRQRTRADYLAVRTWLGDDAWRLIPATLTSEEALALRDRAYAEKGRRVANHVI